MPIYSYKCQKCEAVDEGWRRIEERLEPFLCRACGGNMELVISNVSRHDVSGYPYFDTVLDREITDPGHRRKVLKQLNLEEKG